MAQIELSDIDASRYSDSDDHELVARVDAPDVGLEAYIGIHNTRLGPALGGCRMHPYASTEQAITDVLRLSRGMSYKAALADLPLGGGKSVIIGDPQASGKGDKLEAMGKAIEALQGNYITAEDVGMQERDMARIHRQTEYVTGLPQSDAGRHVGGNPAPVTAYGVYCAIHAAVRSRYKRDSLQGLRVAVQGVGAVGTALCVLLRDAGAELIITDNEIERAKELQRAYPGIEIVNQDRIFSVEADVFAPCAMGAVLDEATIPLLQAPIVAGAANNQLAEARHDQMLADRDILYAPDYIANAGGLICVAYEYFARMGQHPFATPISYNSMMAHVAGIGKTLEDIFHQASDLRRPTGQIADKRAKAIFRAPERKQRAAE